ncbi:MAG: A/G-specific adenine glycosylase [Lewinellaceae bacterium]|nr:A/G-specific adenine glycosylase [Lewinellaceae bacterium]
MEEFAEKAGFFRTRLTAWHAANPRPLPWKDEPDPYFIWLSEVILQQTRVDQGWAYYERFRRDFPTVQDLAAASEDQVLKAWQGLGYYTRARNLHRAAGIIAGQYGGRFPRSYPEILALPGIGPYSAAAIASFAFGLPYAVLDGNVFRVLSRFLGLDTPIDSSEGKKQFQEISAYFLDKERPGAYNQAIMDFGATCCTPRRPACAGCPLMTECRALAEDKVDQYPVKSKKIERRTRYFNYLVVRFGDQVLIRQRLGKDIWQRLYEFPMVESESLPETADALFGWPWFEGRKPAPDAVSLPFSQALTHQTIVAVFWEWRLPGEPKGIIAPVQAVNRKNLSNFAFPKIIDLFLENKSLNLFSNHQNQD